MAIETAKTKCPGQDTMFWKPGDIFDVDCANCGATVEFFKDDAARRCRKCGTRVRNPRLNLGCAQWCEHAKDCLGYDPKERQDPAMGAGSLADILIEDMKKVFGTDEKRITHALSVLEYAEQIMKAEGGDPKIVVSAAILHDIGIQEAERKHGSSAGKYQEIEGPPIAEKILKENRMDATAISDILEIIANHHSAKCRDTLEFRIVWDADWIVNIPEEFQGRGKDEIAAKINKLMRTESGKSIAIGLYVEK